MQLAPEQIADDVFQQVTALAAIADRSGIEVSHVKPHGALYNQAVHDRAIALAIANGIKRWSQNVTVVGLAGSPMLTVFREAGFPVAAEAFADRLYEPDGSLRSRRFDDALIRDPRSAADQAWRIAEKHSVISSDGSELPIDAQTICMHGDTPGAEQIVEAVARRLRIFRT